MEFDGIIGFLLFDAEITLFIVTKFYDLRYERYHLYMSFLKLNLIL